MRIILITGKGGVGKTTVAASTALQAAALGQQTLVMSTDPAHSLSDSFDTELSSDPREVASNCWATQSDPHTQLEDSWEDIRAYMVSLFEWAGIDDINSEELAMLPGLEEVIALNDIAEVAKAAEFETLIVDCAPTAETLRLLSLPEILRWYLERAYPLSRRIHRVVGPVVSKVSSFPVASNEVFDAVERLAVQLETVRDMLLDGEMTSVRLVVNPEQMVVAEARRTATYLSLFGYHLDAVVINRVIPDHVRDPFFTTWKEIQRTQIEIISDAFDPTTILTSFLNDRDVIGVDALDDFGSSLYGSAEPTSVLSESEPLRFIKDDAGCRIEIDLRGAVSDDVDLARNGNDVYVTVGPYRRSITLPDFLRHRGVTSAGFKQDTLTIGFGEKIS